MKIAIVYDAVYPFVKGGVEKRIRSIAETLAKKHEVHLFGMQYWQGKKAIKQKGVYLHGVCRAMELYNKNGRRKLLPPIRFSLCLLPELLKSSFDLVDCQNFPYFPALAAKACCAIKRKPLAITWHEAWGDYWLEYLGFPGFIGKAIESLAGKLTKNNVAVSRQTMQRLASLGLEESGIALIENGIDLDKTVKARKRRRKFDLIYAGRLAEEKSLGLLVNAVALLKSRNKKINCLIVGEGPEKARLQSLAKEKGLEKDVFFKPFVSEEKLFSLMKSSKAFVLPSRKEGFGIAALEAMACGCPLLTADEENNAAKELVREGENGFVFKPEKQSLAEKIIACVENERLLKRMSRKSIDTAKKFSLEKACKKTERYYEQCIAGGN